MTTITSHPPPRYRRNATGETAREAAGGMREKPQPLRQLVLDEIEREPQTGEQVLTRLRAAGVATVLYSVKPRLSDLHQMGLITDSGRRGVSESGKARSIVWRPTTAQERATWASIHGAAPGTKVPRRKRPEGAV